MNAAAAVPGAPRPHPVDVRVAPATVGRDRLTVAFRILLALPHLVLVGAPLAAPLSWSWTPEGTPRAEWTGGGALGAAAGLSAVIAWFALLATGRYPAGLRSLVTLYLRWRVRAMAYTALLRDEYPPFGEGPYPAELVLAPADEPRDRASVAFRIVLALPLFLMGWALGVAWAGTTLVAWFAILLTGRYPAGLYDLGVGILRWSTRMEAYVLLLHDRYPPFSFEAGEPVPAGAAAPAETRREPGHAGTPSVPG